MGIPQINFNEIVHEINKPSILGCFPGTLDLSLPQKTGQFPHRPGRHQQSPTIQLWPVLLVNIWRTSYEQPERNER